MEKDFDRWNKLKMAINASDESERVYFHEGDIWWVRLGVNVGYEIDGTGKEHDPGGHRRELWEDIGLAVGCAAHRPERACRFAGYNRAFLSPQFWW